MFLFIYENMNSVQYWERHYIKSYFDKSLLLVVHFFFFNHITNQLVISAPVEIFQLN